MKKEKSPAFQFYPKDFISDEKVICMTLEEKGAYIMLLSHCWLEGSIPSDPETVGRLLGTSSNLENVLNCFTEIKDNPDRLVSVRLQKEIKKQKDWKKKSSAGGKKSQQNRTLRRIKGGSTLVERVVQANGNSSFASSSSSSSSLEPKHIARKKELALQRERFEILWKDYPEKKGKEKAFIKFRNQVITEKDWEDVQKALVNYKADVLRIRGEGQDELRYQYGSTWFNQNWRDYSQMEKPETWAERMKREKEDEK